MPRAKIDPLRTFNLVGHAELMRFMAASIPIIAALVASHPQTDEHMLDLPPHDVSLHACPASENLIVWHAVDKMTGSEGAIETGWMTNDRDQKIFTPNRGRFGVHYSNAFRLYPASGAVTVSFTCSPTNGLGH